MLVLSLFISQVSTPILPLAGVSPASAAPSSVLELDELATPKDAVAWDDVDNVAVQQRKSNVLFLIEATAIMSFSPKGVLPQVAMVSGWDDSYREGANWFNTRDKFGYTIYDINRMMKDATFGMGALPVAWSGKNLRPERNLYGRDTNPYNNFIRGESLADDIQKNMDRYYFPLLSSDNALTGIYSGQSYPLEVSFDNAPGIPSPTATRYTDLPKGNTSGFNAGGYWNDWDHSTPPIWTSLKVGYEGAKQNPDSGTVSVTNSGMRYNGDEIVKYYDYKNKTAAAKAYPYALVYEDPQYWDEDGGRNAPPNAKLVPNDSRMYQTKLVLWRLLQNKSLFKNLRIG
ncbi:MAG: hypothetical protein LBQ58_00940, partial [Synergistaceae bacterium]|nr:hypothetical protein [Synergistaceae bacterium]